MKEGQSDKEAREGRCLGLDDVVDLSGEESFPASDAPAWSPTHLGPPTAAGGPPEPRLFRDVVQQLRDDVYLLSETIGERNDRSDAALLNLARAADAIEARFRAARVPVRRRRIDESASNVEAVLRGSSAASESVVVAAHYDTLERSPGADDDASGVAVLLSLARSLQGIGLRRTVRLVALAAEEPPHLGAARSGSARYLEELRREGPRVTSMISLEGLGFHGSEPRPWPLRLLPVLRADLAFVGDRRARDAMMRAREVFESAEDDVRIATVTRPLLFAPVRTQSHYAFARAGIPAFMITDTAPLRSVEYHRERDTADRLDFERLAMIEAALARVVADLARA